MKTQTNHMRINEIIFESNDHEVVVRGTMQQGQLSFDSETIVSHTQLNQIVNQLCKINGGFSLENHLLSERMYDGEMLFTACIPKEINAMIDMCALTHFSEIRQVRA